MSLLEVRDERSSQVNPLPLSAEMNRLVVSGSALAKFTRHETGGLVGNCTYWWSGRDRGYLECLWPTDITVFTPVNETYTWQRAYHATKNVSYGCH